MLQETIMNYYYYFNVSSASRGLAESEILSHFWSLELLIYMYHLVLYGVSQGTLNVQPGSSTCM